MMAPVPGWYSGGISVGQKFPDTRPETATRANRGARKDMIELGEHWVSMEAEGEICGLFFCV